MLLDLRMARSDAQVGACGAKRRAGTLRADSACSTILLSIRSGNLLVLHRREATDCRGGCAGVISTHHDHQLQLILFVVDRVLACDHMFWLLLRYSATVHEATAATRRQRRSTSSCLHQRGLIVASNFTSCRVHKSRWLSHRARALLLQRRRRSITHGFAHVRYIVLRRRCRAALMNAAVGLELIGYAT